MPKSAILTLPWVFEDQVFGLDVAVDDVPLVGELEGVAERRDDGERFLRAQPVVDEQAAEIRPVDILHEQEVEIAPLPELMDGHDVRVVQGGQGLGFGFEALGEFRVGRERLREELEGDEAVEGLLAGLEDRPHAAPADELDDLKVGEGGGDFLDRRWRGSGRLSGNRGMKRAFEQAARAKAIGEAVSLLIEEGSAGWAGVG